MKAPDFWAIGLRRTMFGDLNDLGPFKVLNKKYLM